MRRNIVIAGVAVLAVGAALFFLISPALASGLNISSLLPLSHRNSLGPGQALSFQVPGEKAFVMLYNDTANATLSATSSVAGITTQAINGTFLVELVNSGSQGATVTLSNNYTAPMTVMYSTVLIDIDRIYAAILSEFIGFILFIAGIIVAAAGALLRPRAPA